MNEFPDVQPSGPRSDALPNWTFKLFATSANDPQSLSSLYADNGYPGIAIDARASGQPGYTNGIASTPTPTASNPDPDDNIDLGPPDGPCIFLAAQGNDAGVLGNFVRIAVSDIAPDPSDGLYRRGVWFQKVYTGEDCTNKSFRWFLCSPLFTDP